MITSGLTVEPGSNVSLIARLRKSSSTAPSRLLGLKSGKLAMDSISPVAMLTSTAAPDSALFHVTALSNASSVTVCRRSSMLSCNWCAGTGVTSVIFSITWPNLSLRTRREPGLPINWLLKLFSSPSMPCPSMLVKPMRFAATWPAG